MVEPPWSERFELVAGTDRENAARLDAHEVDLALLSTSEFALRTERFDLVPGIGITTRRASQLAWLDYRGELHEVERLFRSTTGDAAEILAPLLFAAAGRRPELVAISPACSEPRRGEAVLRVATDDFTVPLVDGVRRLDLGLAWTDLTGFPFVWSVCVAIPGRVDRRVYGWLHALRRGALDRPFGVATEGSSRHSANVVNVRYRLGREELAGTRHFWSQATAHGFLPRWSEPRFVPFGVRNSGLP